MGYISPVQQDKFYFMRFFRYFFISPRTSPRSSLRTRRTSPRTRRTSPRTSPRPRNPRNSARRTRNPRSRLGSVPHARSAQQPEQPRQSREFLPAPLAGGQVPQDHGTVGRGDRSSEVHAKKRPNVGTFSSQAHVPAPAPTAQPS